MSLFGKLKLIGNQIKITNVKVSEQYRKYLIESIDKLFLSSRVWQSRLGDLILKT